jgi:hypothetical protein
MGVLMRGCNSVRRIADPAEMGLAENDHVIQALAADRPDQPFGNPNRLIAAIGICLALIVYRSRFDPFQNRDLVSA